MLIAVLTLEFRLPACSSLKEKRRRLRGLKDKFGATTNLAITESDFHDSHLDSQWTVVVIGNDKALLDRQLQLVQTYCAESIDGYLVRSDIEFIS